MLNIAMKKHNILNYSQLKVEQRTENLFRVTIKLNIHMKYA